MGVRRVTGDGWRVRSCELGVRGDVSTVCTCVPVYLCTWLFRLICFHHPRIRAVFCEQFAVRAGFNDAAFFEHDDLVGLEDGVETVRDGEHGASLHESPRGFFEQGLGFGVEAGGGFVEDEERRVHEKCPRQRETLRLSAAETRTALADEGLVAIWKRFDKFVQVRGLRGRDHFLFGGVGFAEFDVGRQRVVEEVRALGNPGDGWTELVIGNWLLNGACSVSTCVPVYVCTCVLICPDDG